MKDTGSQRHTRSGRAWWKYLLYGVLGLVGLVLVALLLTQTGLFKNWLKNKVVSTANESLQAQLEIDDLSGNLFTEVELSGLRLLFESDTLASVEHVSIAWSPLDLLDGRLTVDHFLVDSVHLVLREDSTAGWNVTRITPPDTTTTIDTTGSEPFSLPLDIALRQFQLTNMTADLVTSSSVIPRRIDDLRIGFSAMLVNDSQTVSLDTLTFKAAQPDLHVKQLGLRLYRDSSTTQLSDFVVVTERNRFDGRAAYREPQGEQSTASASSAPLNTDEFSFVLPTVEIGVSPRLDFSGSILYDTVSFDLSLDTDTSALRLTGRTVNLLNVGTVADREISYDLQLALDRISLAQWLADTALDYNINGTLSVTGLGIDPDSIDASAVGHFNNSSVYGRSLDTATVELAYDAGDADVRADLASAFGRLALRGSLDDIFGSRRYDFVFSMQQLDLSAPLHDTSLASNLNGGGSVAGRLDTIPPDRSQFRLYLQPSSIYATDIDSLDMSGEIDQGRVVLDTLLLHSSAVAFGARGWYEFHGPLNAAYTLEVLDPSTLREMIGADSLTVHGTLSGHAAGTVDSLTTTMQLDFDSLQYDSYRLAGLTGQAKASMYGESLTYSGDVTANGVSAAGFRIETVNAVVKYEGEEYRFNIDASQTDSLSAGLAGRLRLDTTMTVILSGIRFSHKGNEWQAADTGITISYDDRGVRVDDLRLTSQPEAADSLQDVYVDGFYSFEDSSDITLEVRNIHLGTVAAMLDSAAFFEGNFSTSLKVRGAIEAPDIDGTFTIRDGRFNDYTYRLLDGRMTYRRDRLNTAALLQTNSNDSLTLFAMLPITLMPEDGEYLRYHDSLRIEVVWHRIPLSILSASGQDFESIKGYIDGQLRVYNTLAAPRTAGSISIVDGAISLPEYGIDYRSFTAGIRFDSTRMEVDSIVARTEEGSAVIDGYLNFDSTLLAGRFRERRLGLTADNFFALRHSDYEVKITGSATAEGDADESRFSGDITVNRSNLWLPALTGGTEAADAEGTPMLVAAVGDTLAASDTAAAEDMTVAAADSLFKWYENLRGRVTVNFPRNSWLRSPEMRIEIQGRIEAVKQQPEFELFGSINIVRGYYELFGKRFTFERGEFTFDGGTEMNPRIDMVANYNFRTPERERRKLKLHATGRAFAPEIRFTLDGAEITQGDAAAYIVFGRSLDQLTQGQQSAVASSGGASEGTVAGRLAANLLADQLSKALGNLANLDVIEIKAGESLEGAAIVVGKYLTDRLFVSYQRGVGVGRNEELAPEIVTLEYEIIRNLLFFQLIEGDPQESGFDAILKFHE